MKLRITRLWLLGSIAMLLTQRSGRRPPRGLSTSVHVGAAAVPFAVRCTSPSLWPTQMTSELPTAICAAEWLQYGLSEKWSCGICWVGASVGQLRGGLICTHVGGLPVFTLFVRHSD